MKDFIDWEKEPSAAKSLATSPALYVGLAVGLLLGFVVSAGLALDSASSSRLVGSLLGSTITVGGAVALFFFKEKREQSSRRELLSKALNKCLHLVDAVELEIDNKKEKDAKHGFNVLQSELERCDSLCESHRDQDYRIGEVDTFMKFRLVKKFLANVKKDSDFVSDGAALVLTYQRANLKAARAILANDRKACAVALAEVSK
tara:strand:- start:44 stop:652 length:609 start_codon:yes stop_codon:yes gene_type:complete